MLWSDFTEHWLEGRGSHSGVGMEQRVPPKLEKEWPRAERRWGRKVTQALVEPVEDRDRV